MTATPFFCFRIRFPLSSRRLSSLKSSSFLVFASRLAGSGTGTRRGDKRSRPVNRRDRDRDRRLPLSLRRNPRVSRTDTYGHKVGVVRLNVLGCLRRTVGAKSRGVEVRPEVSTDPRRWRQDSFDGVPDRRTVVWCRYYY